jgi:hypothetical protein
MTNESRQISLAELVDNPVAVFEQVVNEGEAIVVQNEEGEQIIISPVNTPTGRRSLSEEDYVAFRSAAGGWADIDTDQLKEMLYASRQISTRPPVDL